MKVYIESVLLLNLCLDYFILYGTKCLLKIKTSNVRVLLGSILGSLTILFLYYKISTIELILIKIGFGILMNIISFGKKDVIKNTIYFYLISIIVGGSIELIDIKLPYYTNLLFIILVTPFLIKFLIKILKKLKGLTKESYQVKVFLSNKQYIFNGFIDTGNMLKSPISKKSIILIEDVIPKEYSFYIPYKALNYEGLLEIIKPDKIIINEHEIKSCLIGISNNKFHMKDYNCILPNNIKEEL